MHKVFLSRVLSSNSALHLVYEITSVCVLKIAMSHFWGFLDAVHTELDHLDQKDDYK